MSQNNSNCAILPYNEANTLIDEKSLSKLLVGVPVIHNINIYRRAFVHRSYCTRKNENFLEGNVRCPQDCLPLQEESNERLEFLGDAILNLVIGHYLFERFPYVNEGFLTTTRVKLVNGKMLAFLADQINLNKFMIVSLQIEQKEGRKSKNLLEDTFEALIGAIFLDNETKDNSGYMKAREWVINIIEEHVDFTDLMTGNTNYKDKLVKFCQHNYQFVPKFEEISNTFDGQKKEYTICVKNNHGVIIGIGKSNIKKTAEQEASKKALSYYDIL